MALERASERATREVKLFTAAKVLIFLFFLLQSSQRKQKKNERRGKNNFQGRREASEQPSEGKKIEKTTWERAQLNLRCASERARESERKHSRRERERARARERWKLTLSLSRSPRGKSKFFSPFSLLYAVFRLAETAVAQVGGWFYIRTATHLWENVSHWHFRATCAVEILLIFSPAVRRCGAPSHTHRWAGFTAKKISNKKNILANFSSH